MSKSKNKPHYVSNKDFYVAMKDYLELCKTMESLDKEVPPVSDYIADCIWKIASRIATKPNFANYTYRDDMVLDGVENSLRYLRNFNPDKSNNPFSYFTTVITYSFLRRIEKEKRQQYLKYKSMENALFSTQLIGLEESKNYDTSNFNIDSETIYDNIFDFISDYEKKFREKSEKKKKLKPKKKTKSKSTNNLNMFLN